MDNADPFRPLEMSEQGNVLWTTDPSAWTPILPIPPSAPKLEHSLVSRFAPPGFLLSHFWEYRSSVGDLMMWLADSQRSRSGHSPSGMARTACRVGAAKAFLPTGHSTR
jgi:hypothetical protein